MADKFSFLGAIHTNMIEIMYDKYVENPESVNDEWRNFFTGFDFAKEVYLEEDEVPDGKDSSDEKADESSKESSDEKTEN